jgi:hypothetical protein
MAQIGNMTTGAGVVTTLNLPYCPQYLIVNDTSSETFQLTNFSVSINGQSTVELIGANAIDSVAQIKSQVGGDVAGQTNGLMMALELADGQINAPTLIRLTNESTGTDAIFGVSQAVGTAPYRYSQFTVNATSNQQFSEFDSLLIDNSPTNIDSIEIQWNDGFKDRFAPEELPVLFRNQYSAEATSKFGGGFDQSWINNEDGNIANCTIYTNATGSSTVTVGRV